MGDLLPEDRPSKDEIERDDLFDRWLTAYERKIHQEASLRKGQKATQGNRSRR